MIKYKSKYKCIVCNNRRKRMRTMSDMCYHDICNSLVENYNGEDHYEVCGNVQRNCLVLKILYLTFR